MAKSSNQLDEYILRTLDKFCRELYIANWKKIYNAKITEDSSEMTKARFRQEAQRSAIDTSFVSCLMNFYPQVDEKTIWTAISRVHKLHLANLGELGVPEEVQQEVYDRCISAHQSWNKSSGHSFERYISALEHPDLRKNEIRFVLQSELTQLIKDKDLQNTSEDINGLKEWGKNFDLYALQTIHGSTRVFGCIQSKTSIRDRVGRDRTFSENAMDSLFWSVAVTLDGDFLNMPEFISMVNGGGSYPTNSWHGMYAMTGIEQNNNRIYKTNEKLDIFVKHAIQAANQMISDRRKLNRNWKARF